METKPRVNGARNPVFLFSSGEDTEQTAREQGAKNVLISKCEQRVQIPSSAYTKAPSVSPPQPESDRTTYGNQHVEHGQAACRREL